MAKYERHLIGNFDALLQRLRTGIISGSISASFQEGSDYTAEGVRCAVRVYDCYSMIGGNRLSANITLVGDRDRLFLSVIAAGGARRCFSRLTPWVNRVS